MCLGDIARAMNPVFQRISEVRDVGLFIRYLVLNYKLPEVVAQSATTFLDRWFNALRNYDHGTMVSAESLYKQVCNTVL